MTAIYLNFQAATQTANNVALWVSLVIGVAIVLGLLWYVLDSVEDTLAKMREEDSPLPTCRVIPFQPRRIR